MGIGSSSWFILIFNWLKLAAYSFMEWSRRNVLRSAKREESQKDADDAIKRGNASDFINSIKKARRNK